MFTTEFRGNTIRFQTVDSLSRRIGGRNATWIVDNGLRGDTRAAVQVLTPARFNPNARSIVATVFVPTDAVDSAPTEA